MNRKISHSKTRENKIKTIPKYTIGHPPIWKDLNFLKTKNIRNKYGRHIPDLCIVPNNINNLAIKNVI